MKLDLMAMIFHLNPITTRNEINFPMVLICPKLIMIACESHPSALVAMELPL